MARTREVRHKAPPFYQDHLPLVAPCGARRVLMTMDEKKVTCEACKTTAPSRRRSRKGLEDD